MRIHSISIKNFRPFKELKEVRFGQVTTIVGKNDVGKSSILRAIKLFFDKKPKIDLEDFHDMAGPDENIVIEVSFTSLPERIELEEGVETTFKEEMLLDKDGYLRIRKTFLRNDPKSFEISLITQDFQDTRFSGLADLSERELNERCKELGIDIKRAGRGITNKSKREALRKKAREMGIKVGTHELKISSRSRVWKCIDSLLPDFELFESETRTDTSATSFQSQFRPIIKTAAERPEISDVRKKFTDYIEKSVQEEFNKLFEELKRYTDDLSALTVKPVFSWDKAVNLLVYGRDRHGVEKPLEKRGSGLRRLLMVSFFQYLVNKKKEEKLNFIFGIEEPENNLHPGLQRELVRSFRQLAKQGYQIIITTHSPVFAGASPIEDLILIQRRGGVSRAIQYPKLKLDEIAEELGVEPSDQITGYSACVFVEGKDDIMFWKTIAAKLKEGGYINHDFDDKNIGLILTGGDNLKHWIDCRAMKRLNRRFAVIVDSDKRSKDDKIPERKIKWKERCEKDGGIFIILRKRTIENYLHPNAIKKFCNVSKEYNDFTDMKNLFGKNVIEAVKYMTPDEILEMDKYIENGVEHHELKEIIEKLLNLV